jgi:hypothetical protein
MSEALFALYRYEYTRVIVFSKQRGASTSRHSSLFIPLRLMIIDNTLIDKSTNGRQSQEAQELPS